jgi:hypothetical protein
MTNEVVGNARNTPPGYDAILWGGLTAGVLDSIDAVVAFGLTGMNPIQDLQYVASGALGSEAVKGGLVRAESVMLVAFIIGVFTERGRRNQIRQTACVNERP